MKTIVTNITGFSIKEIQDLIDKNKQWSLITCSSTTKDTHFGLEKTTRTTDFAVFRIQEQFSPKQFPFKN